MGEGISCRCKKCGYTFSANLGVGFMLPKVYSETVSEMKKGTFGEIGKQFFEEYPHGAISCDTVVFQCEDCGEYIAAPELSMYIPKDDSNVKVSSGNWSMAFSGDGINYVTKRDLMESYQLLNHYEHRCFKCNGKMKLVTDFEEKLNDGELKCGRCGDVLELQSMIMWD